MPDRISRARAPDDQTFSPSITPNHPIDIIPYFDKVVFWIERPFTDAEEAFIDSQCGPGGNDLRHPKGKRKARFAPRLIQRVEVRQPSLALLKFLSTVEGLFFNMLEITLDLIFSTEEDRNTACEFFDCHLVKRGHRGEVRYDKGTRYTDRRWAQTNLVAYRPDFAKLTGELHCLHVEWRICGIAALRRMGIGSINDLLTFDHRAFWKRRLMLKAVRDFARLGRIYSSGLRKERRNTARSPRVHVTRGGFQYHIDRRLGQMLFRLEDTTQGLLDYARENKLRINGCLSVLNSIDFLPTDDRFD